MEIQKKFEFRTALPEADSHPDEIVDLEHLYFIQLLPNEFSSTAFGRQKMTLPLLERATMTVGSTRGSQETRTLLILTAIQSKAYARPPFQGTQMGPPPQMVRPLYYI
jgi:hypothetical protein